MNSTRTLPFTLLATLCLGLGCAVDVEEPDDFDYELLLDNPSNPSESVVLENGNFVDGYAKRGVVRLTLSGDIPAGADSVWIGFRGFEAGICEFNPLVGCEMSWRDYWPEEVGHKLDDTEAREVIEFDAAAASYDKLRIGLTRVTVSEGPGDQQAADVDRFEVEIDAPFELEEGTRHELELAFSEEDFLYFSHDQWNFFNGFEVVGESVEDL